MHWGLEATHSDLPRGELVPLGSVGTFDSILNGPSNRADGTMNLLGALRRAMATCGYSDLKGFQRVEVAVTGRP
jgi:IMP dehydrogenase